MNKHSWIQSVADVMTVTDNMPCDPASDHNYIFSPFRKVYLTWRPRIVSMVMLQCCKEDIPQFETLHFLGTNNMGSPSPLLMIQNSALKTYHTLLTKAILLFILITGTLKILQNYLIIDSWLYLSWQKTEVTGVMAH